jgi:hypothetical protein
VNTRTGARRISSSREYGITDPAGEVNDAGFAGCAPAGGAPPATVAPTTAAELPTMNARRSTFFSSDMS